MTRELIFRNIAANKGRHFAITPKSAQTDYLSVGYINVDASVPPVVFHTANHETMLMCMNGTADITVDGTAFTLEKYDGMYIPCDSAVVVAAKQPASILESAAPVSKKYPVKVVRWNEIKDDPKRHASVGVETMHRELYQLMTDNVEAGRLMLGPTFSNKGNWTSFPPHEHRDTLEEVYVYFEMPAPGFGIQLAYNDTQHPEVMYSVRENDAMVVHHGFHPNVAVPGYPINFVWILCAKQEVVSRKYGVVNVQPEFKQ
jgi:5-deoxy-glucuronate isomerase